MPYYWICGLLLLVAKEFLTSLWRHKSSISEKGESLILLSFAFNHSFLVFIYWPCASTPSKSLAELNTLEYHFQSWLDCTQAYLKILPSQMIEKSHLNVWHRTFSHEAPRKLGHLFINLHSPFCIIWFIFCCHIYNVCVCGIAFISPCFANFQVYFWTSLWT